MQCFVELRHVVVEVLFAELGEHHLLERARARVELEGDDARQHFPLGDDVADPQGWCDRLGERADVDHALALGHGVERRRTLAAPDQVGIAFVLEDHDAVLAGESDQLGAALLAHDAAGRVLHRRDGVDVLGRDALLLQLGELLLHHVEAHAFLIERNADHVDAEPHQPVDGAAIGLLLDQHCVAFADQQPVDEVERLRRARNHQDLVGSTVDAGVPLEFLGQELAQWAIALRAAVQSVGRKRCALALQHCGCRVDQRVDRHVLGVVVAADEIIFRKSVPLDGRRRVVGRKQGREIEWDGHGASSGVSSVFFRRHC